MTDTRPAQRSGHSAAATQAARPLNAARFRPGQVAVRHHDPPVAGRSTTSAARHALVDGNKRLAFLATAVFLRINGYRLDMTDDEAFDLTVSVAAGQLHVDAAGIEKRLRQSRSTRMRFLPTSGDGSSYTRRTRTSCLVIPPPVTPGLVCSDRAVPFGLRPPGRPASCRRPITPGSGQREPGRATPGEGALLTAGGLAAFHLLGDIDILR